MPTSRISLACCRNGSASRTARRHSRVSFQATTTRRSCSGATVSGTTRTGRPARSKITPGSARSCTLRPVCRVPTIMRSAALVSRDTSSYGNSIPARHSICLICWPWTRNFLPMSSRRALAELHSLFAVALDIDVDHYRCERHCLFRLVAVKTRTDQTFRLGGSHGGHERCSASPPPAAVPWSEYIEALLLFAIQRGVKRVERRPQGLYGLRHDLEPVVHHLQFGFRRRGHFRLARRRHRRDRLARG